MQTKRGQEAAAHRRIIIRLSVQGESNVRKAPGEENKKKRKRGKIPLHHVLKDCVAARLDFDISPRCPGALTLRKNCTKWIIVGFG